MLYLYKMKRQGPALIKQKIEYSLNHLSPMSAQHLISPQNIAPETNMKVTE